MQHSPLKKRTHSPAINEAKAIFCHWCYRNLSIPLTKIGVYLGVTNSAVSRLAEMGRRLVLERRMEIEIGEKK